MADDKTIWVESIVAARNGEPYVVLTWGPMRAQFTPDEARAHALHILQAAQSAENDSFLISFVREELGVEEQHAGNILHAFRQWRIAREKGSNDT